MWRTKLCQPVRTIFTKTPSPPPRHHYHRYQRPPITLSVSLAKTATCIRTSDSHSYSSSILNERTFHFDFSSSLVAHCITSASSAEPQVVVDWNDAVSCSEVGDGANGSLEDEEEDPRTNIPVKAYFFSTSVDLRSLVDQNRQNFIPPTSRMTNYVVLKFGTLSNPSGLLSSLSQGTGASISGSDCCFMVVFQYGSIVLFNVSEPEVDGYLKIVERHASGLLPEMRKDEYEVIEKQTLSTWMQGGLDHIMLQFLNIDGIRIIGSVLGQSIALDYYVRQVDGMVAEFTDINRGMEKTGTFTMESKKLFQLVGKANSNLADVILKLGLFERSDIAWKDAKYAQIWEYLRDEFELTQRFASLDFKLKFVEHNIRFLQEILQNRKSDFLEWLIIILISAEILISLYDLFQRTASTLH
ncbi:protein retarded root growth-like [Citrus sinensis]|uniref:Protein retarded root growth-like n=1 Tax=Citrus sinensis TaxID=2711 RepID=A0ACB8L3Q6_CITSI|nr:protein retarded root growth-like [Citrus sinensis]